MTRGPARQRGGAPRRHGTAPGASPPMGSAGRAPLHVGPGAADPTDVHDAPVRRARTSPSAAPASPYDACAALEDMLGRLRAALGATRVAVWVHEATTATVVP